MNPAIHWLIRPSAIRASISANVEACQKRMGRPSGVKLPAASVVPSAENTGELKLRPRSEKLSIS